MKNIFLVSIFILFFLPQVSFGQTTGTTPTTFKQNQVPSFGSNSNNSQLSPSDQAAVASYQQQAAARAAYMQQHQSEIAQQDKAAVASYQQQAAARAAWMKLHPDIVAQQDKAAIAMYQQQAAARAQAQANQNNSNSI